MYVDLHLASFVFSYQHIQNVGDLESDPADDNRLLSQEVLQMQMHCSSMQSHVHEMKKVVFEFGHC